MWFLISVILALPAAPVESQFLGLVGSSHWKERRLSPLLRKRIHKVSPGQGRKKREIIYLFPISNFFRGNTLLKCFQGTFSFLVTCASFLKAFLLLVLFSHAHTYRLYQCPAHTAQLVDSCVQACFGLLSLAASEAGTSA